MGTIPGYLSLNHEQRKQRQTGKRAGICLSGNIKPASKAQPSLSRVSTAKTPSQLVRKASLPLAADDRNRLVPIR